MTDNGAFDSYGYFCASHYIPKKDVSEISKNLESACKEIKEKTTTDAYVRMVEKITRLAVSIADETDEAF